MAETETAASFWVRFCALNTGVIADEPHQIWYFGNTPEMASELASLVLARKKTATASLVEVNSIKPDEAPVIDGYSIITDFLGEPVCVIQTVEICDVPFGEVGEKFAFDEGEGDRSLAHWRDVHYTYFSREAAVFGIDFNERSLVCCERFRLLYPR